MTKDSRNYLLEVQGLDLSFTTIQPPFTMEFSSTRSYNSGVNNFSIKVMNLAQKTRNNLRKDRTLDFFRQVILKAGYGDNIPVIIAGNIHRAWTYRQGTEYVTQIDGADMLFAAVNSAIFEAFVKDTLNKDILRAIVSTLKPLGIEEGAIGDYPGKISRGNSYSGNAIDILDELSGGGFFVDNGVAHILGDDECLENEILVIGAASGLLGTPILESQIVNVNVLFEPQVKLAQLVKLESLEDPRFNGIYKVVSINHEVMVSPTVCGNAVTSLGLRSGTFNPVQSRIDLNALK